MVDLYGSENKQLFKISARWWGVLRWICCHSVLVIICPHFNNSMAEERRKTKDNDVIEKYRDMITERRYLGAKLAEMQMDLEEHRLVAESLKGVDNSRKCYRMVGGILCQLTVKDVLPILAFNAEQLVKFIEDVTYDVKEKDKEIKAYRQQFSGELKEQDHNTADMTDGPRHRAGGVLVGKS